LVESLRRRGCPKSARTAGVAAVEAHVREVLRNGETAHAAWLLEYLAVIVQRPWSKTGMVVAP
jgi:hypothetical protein